MAWSPVRQLGLLKWLLQQLGISVVWNQYYGSMDAEFKLVSEILQYSTIRSTTPNMKDTEAAYQGVIFTGHVSSTLCIPFTVYNTLSVLK